MRGPLASPVSRRWACRWRGGARRGWARRQSARRRGWAGWPRWRCRRDRCVRRL